MLSGHAQSQRCGPGCRARIQRLAAAGPRPGVHPYANDTDPHLHLTAHSQARALSLSREPRRRSRTSLLLAAPFGAVAGAFKGNDPGLRSGIGYLSAPWLLIAFLPALQRRRARLGALTGLLSTLVALVGFYAALTLTGPLFGAVGAWARQRGSVAPPMIVWALLGRDPGRGTGCGASTCATAPVRRVSVTDWRPYLLESSVGLAVLLWHCAGRARHVGRASRESTPDDALTPRLMAPLLRLLPFRHVHTATLTLTPRRVRMCALRWPIRLSLNPSQRRAGRTRDAPSSAASGPLAPGRARGRWLIGEMS